MNPATRIHYRDHLIARSCFESSPASLTPKRPAISATTRGGDRTHSQLHQLKQKLLHALLEKTSEEVFFKPLCGAANQAAELAWDSPYPLLAFPCLLEELAQALHEPVPPRLSSEFERERRLTSLDFAIANEQIGPAFQAA
jgi:hypothetical protein